MGRVFRRSPRQVPITSEEFSDVIRMVMRIATGSSTSFSRNWRSIMAKHRKIDPEERAYWARVGRDFRAMAERRLARLAASEEVEARRRKRLRRLTFGLLGR
jgi:hypothetical protein